MNRPFFGEDVWGDEIPVETDFLLGSGETTLEPERVLDPLQDDPVEPEQKYVPQPLPPKIQNVAEFNNEMWNKVNNICLESIYLLDCDPREYHPFYLTIDEFIKTGLKQGVVKPNEVHRIWEQFSSMAKSNFEGKSRMKYVGPRSLFVDILLKRQMTSDKRIARLDDLAVKMRADALRENPGADLKDDLTLRLTFFNECFDITAPELCFQMNHLWKELLKEKKIIRKKLPAEEPKEPPKKVVALPRNVVIETNKYLVEPEPEAPPPPVTIPLRKKIKRRKFPGDVPANKPPAKISFIKKRRKAAVGLLKTQKKGYFAERQFQLEMIVNQPKGKVIEMAKTVRRKKCKEKIKKGTTKKSQKNTGKKKKSLGKTAKKIKPLGNTVKKKKKALKNLKQSSNKAGVVRQFRLEKLLTGECRNKMKKLFDIRKTKMEKLRQRTAGPLTKIIKKKSGLAGTPGKKKALDLDNHPSKKTELKPKKTPLKRSRKLSPAVAKEKEAPLKMETPRPVPTTSSDINTSLNKSLETSVQKPKTEPVEPQESSNLQDFFDNLHYSPPPSPANDHGDDYFQDQADDDYIPDQVVNEPPLPEQPQSSIESQFAENTVPLYPPPKKAKSSGPEPDPPAKAVQLQNKSNDVFQKYNNEKLQCPFCRQHISFYNVSVHLRTNHSHYEDPLPCPECNQQFRRRDCWLFHIDLEHKYDQAELSKLLQIAKKVNPKPSFVHAANPEAAKEKCDICGLLLNADYVATHKTIVHSDQHRVSRCPICPNKTFKDTNFLWYHYCVSHADGTPLETMYPEHFTKQPSNKDSSFKKDPGSSKATCDLCGLTFSNSGVVVRHLLKVHGVGDGADNQWPCPTCGKTFKAKDTMDAHHRRIHEGSVKSKCPHCKRDCQSSGKLWAHMVETHRISAAEAGSYCEVEWCLCEYCGVEVLVDRQYGNHVKSNHPEFYQDFLTKKANAPKKNKNYKRDTAKANARKVEKRRLCRETGMGPEWLKLAVADAGNCPECGEHIPKALSNHRRWIHGVSAEQLGLHVCKVDGCEKAFRDHRNLMLHMRQLHTTEIEEIIQDRMIIRVMEKTDKISVFNCTICGMYMCYYEEVKIHCVVNHSDMFSDLWGGDLATRWNCDYCESSFDKVYDMRKHVIETHPDKTWNCETCSKVTLDLEELDRHWETEHAQKGLWFRMSRRSLPGARLAGKNDGGETTQKRDQRAQRSDKLKWEAINIVCEVCGEKRTAKSMFDHIKVVHGFDENMEGLLCNFCPEKPVYKYACRSNWMWHMATFHNINLEDLKKEVGTVHTRQDWRTLERKDLKATKIDGEGKDLVEWRKKQKVKDAERQSYGSMEVKCEVCEQTKKVAKLGTHLVVVHGIVEDKGGLICDKCPKQKVYKYSCRSNWLHHMASVHSDPVEELIQEVSRVHTVEDWRTLNVKNPTGAKNDAGQVTKSKSGAKKKSPCKPRAARSGTSKRKRSTGNSRKRKSTKYVSDTDNEENACNSGEEEDSSYKTPATKRRRTQSTKKQTQSSNVNKAGVQLEYKQKLRITVSKLTDEELAKWKIAKLAATEKVNKENESSEPTTEIKTEVETDTLDEAPAFDGLLHASS